MNRETERRRNKKTDKQKNRRTKKLGNSFFVSLFLSARNRAGFTLIELLVVMSILAVLLALVLVAINPVRQTQQANNTKRRSDINAILNAVNQYATDNAGQLPSGITTTLRPIGTGGSCSITICGSEFPSSSCYDLGGIVASTYIASMPYDSVTGTAADTRYAIKKSNSNNRVTVIACDPELSATIELTQ